MSDYNELPHDYHQRFGGIARLYGVQGLQKFYRSHVLVVGLGGVGSWVAESLARSGVGAITLVDLDDICITNTNRQLPALDGQFGKLKVHALRERILLINPACQVRAIEDFFVEESAERILEGSYDYAVDAIDSLKNKALLIRKCREKNIPVIATGGSAGKTDPTRIKIDDLGLCENDALLFRVRKKLRQDGLFPKIPEGTSSRRQNRQKLHITCIYSDEDPKYPTATGGVCETPDPNSNLKLDCEAGMGSVSHMTAIFGFLAAGHVVNQLAAKVPGLP